MFVPPCQKRIHCLLAVRGFIPAEINGKVLHYVIQFFIASFLFISIRSSSVRYRGAAFTPLSSFFVS